MQLSIMKKKDCCQWIKITMVISTDEEFARARVFTSIYNDELARLKEEYGEKAKGNVSYSKIKVDISAERSKEKNNNEGNTIDLQI